MRIKLKSSNLFAFAGLYEKWNTPEGNPLYTCTIITTKPNELMEDIHDRMPVILTDKNEKEWLNPKTPILIIFKAYCFRMMLMTWKLIKFHP